MSRGRGPGGGGGLPYESDGDSRRKIRINTLKETNLAVALALFNPKGDHAKTDNQIRAIEMLIALKMLQSNAVFYE